MRLADRLRSAKGFTLIELLVAMAVCVVGIMATVGVIDASRHVVSTAEKREAMVHQAERSLDEVLARAYAGIAHAPGALPTWSAAPHPNSHVSGTNFQYDWNSPGTEPLAVDATGLTAFSSQWNDGQSRLSGWTFRYVTNVNGSAGNAKRVTVAVTVNGRDAPDPVVISSIVTQPALN